MSSKSKKPFPTVVPKPKYRMNQIVFIITYHRGVPENIFEAKITGRSAHEYKLFALPGTKVETATTFRYDIHSDSEMFMVRTSSASESDLYVSYTEAAKVFAKAFLKPLK